MTWSANSTTIPRRSIFELTFLDDRIYAQPFFDVDIEVTFTSPSGKVSKVGGFYYGSLDPPEIVRRDVDPVSRRAKDVQYRDVDGHAWKARFAPGEIGTWKYSFTYTPVEGPATKGSGSFSCVKPATVVHGFLGKDPDHPERLLHDDGTPFFPFGFQNCQSDYDGTGTVLDTAAMDGPFSQARSAPLPEGPMFVRSPAPRPYNADVYFRAMKTAGFNLFRFSQDNCSFNLYKNLDSYNVHEAVMVDELLAYARKYDFSLFYGIFGNRDVDAQSPDNEEMLEKTERFIRYSVNRWGAYVDIWEILNEQRAGLHWYQEVIAYLKSVDPYHHLITTSWPRPEIDGIDITSPHWYQDENELESDLLTVNRIKHYSKYGKPVIFGEQGNWADPSKPKPPGSGGVWDPRSALRMRLRNWTAFFNEAGLVYWVTSYTRDGHDLNIWIGPTERDYMRALTYFASRMDKGVEVAPVEVSDPAAVRAYALRSKMNAAVYLHHFASHETPATGITVTIDAPRKASGYWYDPATSNVLGTVAVSGGRQSFTAPDFRIDLALLITSSGPPDIDHDGVPNMTDRDNDNDGVPDVRDAFPLDPSEWADADGDLIGDNMDMDTNGDGISDDRNHNGKPDALEWDLDGDGVDQGGAVPWDAFPFDPTEWNDNDGDGIGDSKDVDDDNDGVTDQDEIAAGTDPMSNLSFPPRSR